MNNKSPLNLLGAVLILNLVATGCLAGLLITRGQPESATSAQPASAGPVLDLEPLAKPIEQLDQRLAGLTTTLQRLNTSTVQFDFLESELEQLAALERGLILRGRALDAARTEENTKQTDEAIKQVTQLISKVQEERLNRRRTLIALIAGLEKQLAGLSGATMIADQVPETPAAVEPEPVTETPATAPTSENTAAPDNQSSDETQDSPAATE